MLALASLTQAPPGGQTSGSDAAVSLPPSPAARAFASVGPKTKPASLPALPIGDLDSPAWRSADAWSDWATAVRAEARADSPDAQRRARLARIALAQGRWDDAWDHFASTGSEPGVCAALLPQFLPGVASEVGDGGIPAPLPDGVLLRPAAPPPPVAAAEVSLGRTWIDRREMHMEGLHVGAAVLSMKVSLESDGIQIDFDHKGGGAAHLRVVLPELADFQVRVSYVDWMRQDEVGGVLEFDIAPGDETHTLFGRFRPRAISWPTNLPRGAPRFLELNGLEFAFPVSVPDGPMFQAALGGFSSVLGLPVTSNPKAAAAFAGVRIDLSDPSVARRKFLGMVTLSERFALRRAAR